ncbi:hypothetical protein SE17_22410 [Kouleothrix aurantiaca]|uniref:Leucine-binding protein domain-containing protein n=1 Tax=Kouleothrix aurantiaca TaxID=186479 RepID=A0A0P9F402_9CHLR|nr:hypothetical protein SE17_22410 [Kouleothrix aurantiaca]
MRLPQNSHLCRSTRIVMLLLCALLLAARGAAPPDASALDTGVAFARPAVAELPRATAYRIGLNTEVTGTGAQLGDLSIRAARLAVEEINAAGGINGIPLELVVRDCRSSAATALEQYRLALSEDQLTALIGPFKSAYAVGIVPEHRISALPMLIGANTATLTAQGDTNLFRMRPSDSLTAAAMAALATDRLAKQRIAIIHDSDAFGTGGAEHITSALAMRSLAPVARADYRTGTRDFDALAQTVAAARPDAVLIYATNTTDLGFLLRAIRYWKIDASIITSPSGATTVTHDVAAEAQDGIYVAMDAFLPATPQGRRFVGRFTERFGVPPDTYIAWYYDAMFMLAGVVRARGSAPQDVSAGLRATTFEGVQGAYHFDAQGEGLHDVTLVQMRGGAAQRIGMFGTGGFQPAVSE